MRALLLLMLSLATSGCDWAAADGPWNRTVDNAPPTTAAVEGSVCTPSGFRDVPGLRVVVRDTMDAIVAESETDPWGRWSFLLEEGRFTVEAGVGGVFEAFNSVLVGTSDLDAGALCLDRSTPQALVIRAPISESTDFLGQRLSGLGLVHVHDGPDNAAEAAQILAAPTGLVEYGIVALLGGLDADALASSAGALDGLRDHLEDGGGVMLAADAWPVLEVLAPGAIRLLDEVAAGGWLEAEVVADDLVEQLRWDRVGIPLSKDALLFEIIDAEALVSATVPTGGGEVTADLLVRVPVLGGTVVLSSFLAPPPRADSWWMGDPAEVQLPDGAWDGRGALLDRVVLRF